MLRVGWERGVGVYMAETDTGRGPKAPATAKSELINLGQGSKISKWIQAWRLMALTPALRRWRQESDRLQGQLWLCT